MMASRAAPDGGRAGLAVANNSKDFWTAKPPGKPGGFLLRRGY